MSHKVKCKYCEQIFDRDKEPAIKEKNRYFHKKCYEIYINSLSQEDKDITAFYDYTKNLFGQEYNYMMTKRLAEQYHKNYGYTYSGMLSSLKWFYEIKGNSLEKSNGSIGIIPYIYNDAKKYYYNLYLAQQKNKQIKNYIAAVEEITIPPPEMLQPKPKLWFDDEEDDE
jgi:phage/plasmid-associated DNA primase